jgi:tRNA (cmo5U34)-methyltransferase
MSNQQPPKHFGEDHAAAYDTRFARLAPFKDALHLCMRAVLTDLPEDARILCVGAGTGAELLYLADAFPRWTFTAVEPAAPMLDRCREKAAEAGIADRCTFHEGYLDFLPPAKPFDAATSILVSQFVLVRQKRCNFFQDIAARLKPGGHLVTADLSGKTGGHAWEAWMALMKYNDVNDEQRAHYREALEKHVAVESPAEVEAIITEGGFDTPRLICHALLMHTWHARRSG